MPRLKRFVVSESSMMPTLYPGDGIIAARTDRIRRGEIRCFEHPHRPGFWLVKRVGDVTGGEFAARSDRSDPDTVDSRRFGPVPITDSWRAVLVVRDGRPLPGHLRRAPLRAPASRSS